MTDEIFFSQFLFNSIEIDIETTTNANALMMFDKEENEGSTTMIDETMTTTTTTESVPISVLRKRKLDGHGTIDPSIDDTIDFSKRIMRIEKPEWLKKNNNEKDDDYDDDDDGDDDDNDNNEESYESNPNSICTASYFFDRVIPDDYPHEISKDVKHINETIERLNR